MSDSRVLPDGRIVRYTFRERLMHWTSGLSYLYLLATGLAIWHPWFFWLGVVLGGMTISRALHPWAGLIFMLSVVWMYRIWAAQMHGTPADREWWRRLRYYVRNEDDKLPPEDRFNAGQKALFWGFFWCSIALLLSGLVLWFPHWIPWSLRFLRLAAVVVHPVAALLTIALFMIHVYMGTAVERGAFRSMVRGDVSPRWAARFHRLWYEQIVRGSSAKE
jgi:formate dehydrogenase subunit gamma